MITIRGSDYPTILFLLQSLVIGLIAPEEFDGDRFVILGRVSTGDQLRNTDFDNRLQPLRDHIINQRDGEIVKEFTGSESGATVEREKLNEILRMAEGEQFDVLALRNLDRLSRAAPWDTINYLLSLREAGIVLYEQPERYYAWDNLHDFQRLSQQMFFSREWYKRIEEGRREGVHDKLGKGCVPMDVPLGYEKDETRDDGERNIYLNESQKEMIYRIFETYKRTLNIAETTREVSARFEDKIDEKVTRSKIQTVLSSRKCIGELAYEGVTIREMPELATVSEELFEEVQSILDSTGREEPNKIPKTLAETTANLGIEYVHSKLEQISFRRCKLCGGQLKPYSKTEIWGIPVEKVCCEDCEYDGPLLSEEEFREIHQTAPLNCPFCFQTGDFKTVESPHGLGMYEYKCNNCDRQFHTDVEPGKMERYLNNTDLGVELGEETGQERDSTPSNEQDHSKRQMRLSEL